MSLKRVKGEVHEEIFRKNEMNGVRSHGAGTINSLEGIFDEFLFENLFFSKEYFVIFLKFYFNKS